MCPSADESFLLRFLPLSALKHLLFHSHELRSLRPCLKRTLSGHAACLRLCFCCCRAPDGSQYARLCASACGGSAGGQEVRILSNVRPCGRPLALAGCRGPGGTLASSLTSSSPAAGL